MAMVGDENMTRSENQSMRKSRVGDRYFRIDPGYNKEVYENTWGNWLRILGSFAVFYILVAFFWSAVFIHGIQDADSASILYLVVFVIAVAVIGMLLFLGHFSTKKLVMINKITVEMDEEIKKKKAEDIKQKKKEAAQKEKEALATKQFSDDQEDESEGDEDENEGDSEEPSED